MSQIRPRRRQTPPPPISLAVLTIHFAYELICWCGVICLFCFVVSGYLESGYVFLTFVIDQVVILWVNVFVCLYIYIALAFQSKTVFPLYLAA